VDVNPLKKILMLTVKNTEANRKKNGGDPGMEAFTGTVFGFNPLHLERR